MTMADFISIMGLAVAVAQLVATLTPGRRLILLTGATVLAVLSLLNLYTSSTHRRHVQEAQHAMLNALDNDSERRTYDELRQELYDINGAVFDAALEDARRSGQIGFRLLTLRAPTGEEHDVRGYFKIPAIATD
jgi:hypothetical protein